MGARPAGIEGPIGRVLLRVHRSGAALPLLRRCRCHCRCCRCSAAAATTIKTTPRCTTNHPLLNRQAKSQADRNELLMWAAARGLLADAAELLAQGADPGTRDKRGLTAAHFAAAHGHLDVLQYLAAKGADLDAEDARARAPLHYAAAAGGGRFGSGGGGSSGSSATGGIEALRFLASKSAWLDGGDEADDTALHLAARAGWLPGVSLLLGAGAKHGARNKRGLTPLGEAVAGGHADAAKALLAAGADARCGAGDGYSLLHVAAGLGHARCVKLLLEAGGLAADVDARGGPDGAAPLHAAAMGGAPACAEALLAAGADALAAAADGRLPADCVPDAAADGAGGNGGDGAGAGAKALDLETLKALLSKAADKARAAGGKPSAPPPAPTAAPKAGAAATGGGGKDKEKDGAAGEGEDGGGGPAAYAEMFGRLAPHEQDRRADALARLPEAELAGLGFVAPAARGALAHVRRALQLLACFRAVSAIHRDAQFQEDASEARVARAVAEMRAGGAPFEKWAARSEGRGAGAPINSLGGAGTGGRGGGGKGAASSCSPAPSFHKRLKPPNRRPTLALTPPTATATQNNRYAADSQVCSVMGKLRKLQAVLRDNGGLTVSLEELAPGAAAALGGGGDGKSLAVRFPFIGGEKGSGMLCA